LKLWEAGWWRFIVSQCGYQIPQWAQRVDVKLHDQKWVYKSARTLRMNIQQNISEDGKSNDACSSPKG
jgi:hypothetical protein